MPEAAGFLAAASTPHGLITLLVFAVSLVLFISGWLAPELTGLFALSGELRVGRNAYNYSGSLDIGGPGVPMTVLWPARLHRRARPP